jgi:hypothetical protein
MPDSVNRSVLPVDHGYLVSAAERLSVALVRR